MTREEAIKAIKAWDFLNNDEKEVIETLIPELKESDDERIRKEIISALKYANHKGVYDKHLAWLEKQGDKPFDYENANIQQKDFAPKQEPKFKVGDFIVNDYCMGKVIALTDDAYLLDSGQGIPFSYEHNAHLWTIKDAKDGDVLYCKSSGIEFIVMNKGVNEHGNIDSYFRYNSLNGFGVDIPSVFSTIQDNITPATKEQRDTLMKAMADAGYIFDYEKKELKKIHVIDEGKDELDYCFTKMMNGEKVNPTWSEEDEKNWRGVIDEIIANKHDAKEYEWKTYDKFLDWLKSLKERYTWKPSERMLEALKLAKCEFHPDCSETMEQLKYLYQELKQLYYDRT